MESLKDYEILLGTYEEFVLGYKLNENIRKPEFEASFADHSHAGSVRSLAAADKYLITSGADETVKIFNLRNRSEHGTLNHADSMINAMKFYDKKHLITCAEDGKVCIIRTGNWNVEKTLLKHSQGVIDVAVHPSGKMALTIGKDKKLITWNLIKGRSAFVTNIYEIADFVKWSPDGKRYLVGFYKHVDVYSVDTAAIEFSVKLFGRSNDVVFLDNETFALAGDMSQIEIHSLVKQEMVHKFEAHEKRVRCMSLIDDSTLITASNDGKVKIWKIAKTEESFEFTEKMELNTKCRITSMVVHKVPQVMVENTKINPEEVEALAKMAVKKKRSVGFSEPEKVPNVKETEQTHGQTLLVEIDNDDESTEPKKKKKKKKNKQKSSENAQHILKE